MNPAPKLEEHREPLEPELEPLALTSAQLNARGRRAVRAWLLVLAAVSGAGLTAKQTGALDVILSRPKESAAGDVAARLQAAELRLQVDENQSAAERDLERKRLANIDRKLAWLIGQEVRRQAREGREVEPPEDIQ